MNVEIKKENKNELLKRKEIEIVIESVKNPSFDEAKKIISEKFSIPEERINVYNIIGGFGRKNFSIKAYIYDSKKDLEQIKKLQLTRKKKKEIINQALEEKKKAEEEGKKAEEKKKKSEEEKKKEMKTTSDAIDNCIA